MHASQPCSAAHYSFSGTATQVQVRRYCLLFIAGLLLVSLSDSSTSRHVRVQSGSCMHVRCSVPFRLRGLTQRICPPTSVVLHLSLKELHYVFSSCILFSPGIPFVLILEVPMPDSLALWALLVPPAIGLLWALHESWSVFRVRLDGPLKGKNKRIRGPLYEEVRPDKTPDPSISDIICPSASNSREANTARDQHFAKFPFFGSWFGTRLHLRSFE